MDGAATLVTEADTRYMMSMLEYMGMMKRTTGQVTRDTPIPSPRENLRAPETARGSTDQAPQPVRGPPPTGQMHQIAGPAPQGPLLDGLVQLLTEGRATQGDGHFGDTSSSGVSGSNEIQRTTDH